MKIREWEEERGTYWIVFDKILFVILRITVVWFEHDDTVDNLWSFVAVVDILSSSHINNANEKERERD